MGKNIRCAAKIGIAALASAGLLLGATGCSTSAAPSRDDIADALLGSADFSVLHSLGYSDADVENIALCIADALPEKFSQESLQALASGQFDEELSEKEYATLSSAMMDCALENNTGEAPAAG